MADACIAILSKLPNAGAWPAPAEGMPMQTQAWTQARVAIADPDAVRFFCTVRDERKIQAIAPLLRFGDWLWEPPAMFEPSDFIWNDTHSLQTLTDYLAGQRLSVALERLPAESPTLKALHRSYARRGAVEIRPAMPTPCIQLAGRPPDSDAWYNARRRADFRRAERLASRFGAVTYTMHFPKAETECLEMLDLALRVEAVSWKAKAGSALTTNIVQGDFYSRFVRFAAREGLLCFAFLHIGDRPAAMQIACQWRQRFWLLKISHDQAFARCSPGQLLLRHTLRHAHAAGLHSYEFMGVMADWTRLWTLDARQYVQVRAIPFSASMLKTAVKENARSVVSFIRKKAGFL